LSKQKKKTAEQETVLQLDKGFGFKSNKTIRV